MTLDELLASYDPIEVEYRKEFRDYIENETYKELAYRASLEDVIVIDHDESGF